MVRLRRPDGGQAMPNAPEISVNAIAGQDVNVIVELNNLSFTTFGTHRFDLEIDGQAAGGLPVSIVAREYTTHGLVQAIAESAARK